MQERKNHALRGALCGLACAVGTSIALAAPPESPVLSHDTATNPVAATARPAAPTKPMSLPRRSIANEGGIAGTSVLYAQGFDTGEDLSVTCSVPGATRSTVQNLTPICLTVAGFNIADITALGGIFRGADDFTLTRCAKINRVTLYAFAATPSGINIGAGTVSLHSSRPWASNSNIVATSNIIAEPPSLTTVFRASLTTATPCLRAVQQVILDTSAWPRLPPGTYWISWALTHNTGTGTSIFSPPTVALGAQSNITGAPAQQALVLTGQAGAVFGPILDTGVVGCVGQPPAPGAEQDFPFVLEGHFGHTPCPGDRNADCKVDVDDLVTVILTWGQPDATGVVDVDDLVTVILQWAQGCMPPAPGPIATGGCCVSGNCTVQTFAACAAAGGTYVGDGSNCAGGCSPPANDECAGAIAVGLGNTNLNTTFATNGGPAILAACAFQLSRDVWLSMSTNSGQSYTVDTLLTPPGPAGVGDTGLVVYRGTCDVLVDVNCNDDSGGGTLSSVTFVGDGTTHFIRVGAFVAAQTTVAPGGSIVVRVQ